MGNILCPGYETLGTVFNSNKAITFTEMKTRIKFHLKNNYKVDSKKGAERSKTDLVFPMTQPWVSKASFNGNCFNCSKQGHPASECRSLGNARENGNSNNNGNGNYNRNGASTYNRNINRNGGAGNGSRRRLIC